jgi:hypothetical protein
MIGVAALMMASALLGQHCGYGHQSYSYYPQYNYGYQAYSAPYVQAKLTVVATEPDYGAGLLGQDARYAVKAKAEEEFRAALLAKLDALKPQTPAPAPTVQTFQAPQYAPAPAYGPSPQQPQPQAAPQAPAKALQAPQVPQKGFYPAVPAPQAPASVPAAGDWGQPPTASASPEDSQQVLASIMANRCMDCHSVGNPSGGMAFFDDSGNPLPLSVGAIRKIDRAVSAGRMPKGRPLPPTEAAAIDNAIVSMYQQARR